MYGYKVLNEDQSAIYGAGKWVKNRPRSVKGELIPCERGIHYCRDSQLVRWLGPMIWRFEDLTPGETIDAGDKMVTRKGKIVEKCENWNETTARLFAADVAELALVYIPESRRDPFVAAINAARGFARGEINDAARAAAWAAARAAAWAAAWDAARDAARAAAWDAARGAARAAARAAAWDAAWDAARDAARAAAWDAARGAARDAQTIILFDYLEGRRS